jgi:hypothetical protein
LGDADTQRYIRRYGRVSVGNRLLFKQVVQALCGILCLFGI